MKKRKCKVVMLPTEKATWPNCIWLGRISEQLRIDTSYNSDPRSIIPFDDSMLPQHLYFLSDERIKEGDWFLGDNISIKQCTLNNAGNINFKGGWYSGSTACKKIIATTDTSLRIYGEPMINGTATFKGLLPQPSPQFIAKYIKAWNMGIKIVEVMVEHEEFVSIPKEHLLTGSDIEKECKAHPFLLPKVDKNNCITITTPKDAFTLQEISDAFNAEGVYYTINFLNRILNR